MHDKALSLHVIFMLLPLLTNQYREEHGEILSTIANIVDEGKLRPLIDVSKFTLAQTSDAHAHFESWKANGKVVLSVREM